ncbi:hypothetical protein BT93_L0420 [Corymbia citriodora subsp. variegata]|uniref:Protein EARLY FLOWERING 4 domain-containing protein n=1 Tax=Corymbia citriodora subsp. variegata TaxID=360336 RepID=A0A8T0CTN1_CORYI|nr:hypothetical protein BT93_L0420 [Corymbia citriodora subsp. variegata]
MHAVSAIDVVLGEHYSLCENINHRRRKRKKKCSPKLRCRRDDQAARFLLARRIERWTTPPPTSTAAAATRARDSPKGSSEAEEALECDPEVWKMFSKSFRQVQTVLDQNRALIRQVNENHRSKSADNMVKNVALIQERRAVPAPRPKKAAPNRDPYRTLSIVWGSFWRNEGLWYEFG